MTDQLPVVKPSNLKYGELQATKGLITPEVAAQLLDRNFDDNRSIASTVMRRYSRLIKEGRWELGDSIKFAEDGTLIDGQHRLNAVINAGVSAPFVILTGLPKQSCEILDQGKKRDVNNVLQFRGKSFQKSQVSTIRMAIAMGHPDKQGQGNNKSVLSASEVATLMEHFEDGLNFSQNHRTTAGAIVYAPVLSVIFMAYYKENHDRLNDFLYCWHNGTVRHGIEDNAAILLRNVYFSKKQDFGGNGMTGRLMFFNRTQTALSYFLKGECPKHFKETTRLLWGSELFNPEALAKILDNAK